MKYAEKLAKALLLAYNREKDRGGWRTVSREYFHDRIPAGTLNRIAKTRGKYIPKNPDHLRLLKFPYNDWPINALISASLIGKEHLREGKKVLPKSIQTMSNRELLHALQNREVIFP